MSSLNNVTDRTTDQNGNPIQNLKHYGDKNISENAEFNVQALPFITLGKIMRTNNRDLSRMIREAYSLIFHELCGVNILYAPRENSNMPFIVEFYFAKNQTPCPDEKITSITDLTTGVRTDSLFYKKQVVNNRIAGKHFALNDETKVLLSDIMFGGRDANKPNASRWNNFVSEIWVPVNDFSYNPRSGQQLLKVAGCFDIYRILNKLFGTQMVTTTQTYVNPTDNNIRGKNIMSSATYEVRFIKYSINEPYVFIMSIEQFDTKAVKEYTLKENPVRSYSTSGVIYY